MWPQVQSTQSSHISICTTGRAGQYRTGLLNACKALEHSPPISSKMCKWLSFYCWGIMALIWWLSEGGLSAGTLSSAGSLTGCCWGWELWQWSSGDRCWRNLFGSCPITTILWYLLKQRIWKRHWNNTEVNKGPWNSSFKPEFGIWRRKYNFLW